MSLKAIVPTPTAVGREALTLLGATLLVAFILSRFPNVRAWVAGQSITVRDPGGNVLF